MDTQEILRKVRRVEIKSKGLSTQVFSGSYHSAFKGRGMAFSEVRTYQYGDDVRAIDWNVTARFQEPFIKVFEEERELTMMLMIDVSRSAYFGTNTQMKNELITELSAVLSFSAINNNDKVGVIFFSDHIEKYIPPKKGKNHILRIIRELVSFEPTGVKTDISFAIQHFNNVVKRRAIAFVISDFMDEDYQDALSIANRKHDVVGIRVFDAREAEMPDVGLMQVLDSETGKATWVDTSLKKVRNRYKAKHLEQRKKTQDSFLRAGVDLVEIQTGRPYINALMSLFKKREQRR